MKKALVSGATSGIGHAIAVALAKSDYQVLALGRDEIALASLEQIPGISAVAADITEGHLLSELFSGQTFDVLVNNAGMMPQLKSFHELPQEEIDHAIAVNLSAQLALTRLISPGMVKQQHGHIFFTGSTAGHSPFEKMAVYCATKAAIGGFAQALRLDMAEHAVRVTEIVAGRIQSNLYKDLLSEEQREAMYAGNCAVLPEDVASMLLSVLAMPQRVDVARFDILPTHRPVKVSQLSSKKG